MTVGQASGIGQSDALRQLTPAVAKAMLGDQGYDSMRLFNPFKRREKPFQLFVKHGCDGLSTGSVA